MKKFIVVILIVALWGGLFYQLIGKENRRLNTISQLSALSYKEWLKTSYKNTLKKQVDTLIKKHHYNGSVYITYHNETLINQAYGFKDAAQTEPFDKNSMYLIGSSQKLITGIITKQLVDSGQIDVNAPVQKYVPNFIYPDIKIKDLILHRSGLAKFKNRNSNHGLDASIDEINQYGLGNVPIGSFFYNDANYILLAKVIENVTGKTYQENVKQRIFDKYHLKESAFFNDEKLKPYFVKGLKFINNTWQVSEARGLDKFYGAGNIYMSPKDMGVLLNDLMHYKVLNKSQFNSITTPIIFNTESAYRYGMYLKKGYYRTRGYFYGTDFVGLFNHDKVVVIATNKQKDKEIPNNEKLAREIFKLLK